MAQLSLVLCDLMLNPIAQEWAIEEILSATIQMEELDQFSPHSVTVSGSFRRNLNLLNGMTAVQIIDADVGTIAYGLIVDPENQITAEDQHTITLNLPNITELLRYSTTGQGWVAGYVSSTPLAGAGGPTDGLTLAQIVERLGAMRAGWFARCVDYGHDAQYVLRFEDATLLGALLDAAEKTGGHARQVHLEDQRPTMGIELGVFGAAPAMEIITPEGGDAQQILTDNPNARLAETITIHPADYSKLVNVMTPLGAGSGINQVRFRRLFKILYDITYDHCRYKNGMDPTNVAALMAQYFPEYDPAYEIPGAPGGDQRWHPTRPFKGNSWADEFAIRLDTGADGYEYCIRDVQSLHDWNQRLSPPPNPGQGEFRAPFTDASISYVDSNINNQELSERALYVAAKAQLQWYSQPQRSVSVTTVGTRRPPRAGDKVLVNYGRTGLDALGSFPEIDERNEYYVVGVVREYGDVVRDTWTLTSNGRHPPDATSSARDTTRGMIEAIRIVPTTSVAIYPFESGRVKIDATHPHTIYWEIPASAFRIQQAKFHLTTYPVRHDIQESTTDDGAHRHDVTIPALKVNVFPMINHVHEAPIPNHTHGGVHQAYSTTGETNIGHGQGRSVDAYGGGDVANSGRANQAQLDNQLLNHQHTIGFISGGDPDSLNPKGIFFYSGSANPSSGGAQIQSQGRGGTINTNYWNASINSDHGHGSSVKAGGGGIVNDLPYTTRNLGSGATPVAWDTIPYWSPYNATDYTDTNFYFQGVTTPETVSTIMGGQGTGEESDHHHAFVTGIFEEPFTPNVNITLNNGKGLTHLWSFPGWVLGSTEFTQYVEDSVGVTITFELRGVGDDSNNKDGLCEVSLSGFAVVELLGVGSQVLQG